MSANQGAAESAPVIYIPHGGGPLPLLGDRAHLSLIDFLTQLGDKVVRPSAILLISAHWECDQVTLTSGDSPPLIYDYYGFPPESYEIQYAPPGSPDLAEYISTLLQEEGIDSRLDTERGYDHGMFVPLKLIYPEAKIPCVQLSLQSALQAEDHIKVGQALQRVREENVLIIGSGLSFHNMECFFLPMKEAGTSARNLING